MKIFWSWQSDIDGKISRHFIKECLTEAIEEVSNEILLDERLEVDHDTKGVLGSPSIMNTILQKIIDSNLFIGDVTPVALTKKEKKVMNPNVAIEMGYAISEKGDGSIITIMNTVFGEIEDLPFDLRHKRGPVTYFLSHESSKEDIAREKKRLVSVLKDIIKEHVSAITSKKIEKDSNSNLEQSGGIFFDLEKPLVRMSSDGWGGLKDKEIMVKMEKSYIYVKVTPKVNLTFLKEHLNKVILEGSNFKITPMFNRPDNTPITNKYGSIVVKFDAENKNHINDFTQVFQDGKIIGINNSYLYYSKNIIYLVEFKNKLERFLKESISVIKNLNQLSDLEVDVEIGFINKDDCKVVLPNLIGNKRYDTNKRGPLEEEVYILKKFLKTDDTGKVEEIVKGFILLLIDDLGLEFDYEHHVWN